MGHKHILKIQHFSPLTNQRLPPAVSSQNGEGKKTTKKTKLEFVPIEDQKTLNIRQEHLINYRWRWGVDLHQTHIKCMSALKKNSFLSINPHHFDCGAHHSGEHLLSVHSSLFLLDYVFLYFLLVAFHHSLLFKESYSNYFSIQKRFRAVY